MWADDIRINAKQRSRDIKFRIFVATLAAGFMLVLTALYLGICIFKNHPIKDAYFFGLMIALVIDALVIAALCLQHKLRTARWPTEEFGPWWPYKSEREAMRMDFDIEVI